MVDELDGLGVEREGGVIAIIMKKELHGRSGQLERDGLGQVDVVAQDLVVLEIKAQGDDLVDMVVGEEVEDGGPGADVLDEDRQRLQHLHMQHTISRYYLGMKYIPISVKCSISCVWRYMEHKQKFEMRINSRHRQHC